VKNRRVKVESYAGHKADQQPIRFYLENRCHEIEAILKQWQEPAATYWRVRADDGNTYTLRLARTDNVWTLESFTPAGDV